MRFMRIDAHLMRIDVHLCASANIGAWPTLVSMVIYIKGSLGSVIVIV